METHLHLGAHRTGTTAAQKLLQSRASQLRAAGVAYLGPLDLRGWGLYDLIQRMIDGRAAPDQVDGAREILAEALSGADPVRRAVISDENLAGSLIQNYATATLYPEAEARLKVLADLLPQAPDLVCFTVRDLAAYWQSAFAHLSLRSRADRFDAARLAHSPSTSWLPVLQAARSAFPKARITVFRHDEAVVPRLISTLVGTDLAATFPAPKRSFGLALSEELSASVASLPPGRERERAALRLRETRDGPERSFSPDEDRHLKDAYAADWSALRDGALTEAELDPAASEANAA